MNFQNAESIILQHPDSVFDIIASSGYSLEWNYESLLTIHAKKDGKIIATCQFIDNGNSCHCQKIYVEKDHQRQKLATSMYLLARRITNKRVLNFSEDKGNLQTSDAKGLWEQLITKYPDDVVSIEVFSREQWEILESKKQS